MVTSGSLSSTKYEDSIRVSAVPMLHRAAWPVPAWCTEVEVVAGARDRLLLYTAGLPGFDAEVTERREPELLAMRCDEAGRRTRLTCAVTPTAEGCRLSVREVRGARAARRRRGQ